MTDNTTTMARRTIYRSTARKLTDGMREFLERQPFAMLGTYNPDGSIHVVPLSYFFEDGRFFMATSSSSRKVRNLSARPEATITVDDRSTLEWVSATGTAELIRGQRSREINARLYSWSWTDAGLETVGPLLKQTEDVSIAITPRTWRAWDIQSTFFAACNRRVFRSTTQRAGSDPEGCIGAPRRSAFRPRDSRCTR